MSLKIENCKPISVFVQSNNITLSEMKTLLPDAIEILANYGISYNAQSCYHYKVLMPYKFTAPSQPVFGDRLDIYVTDPCTLGIKLIEPGTEDVLSQDVAYIIDYEH